VTSSSRFVAGLAAIALLGAIVIGLQMRREARYTSAEPAQQVLYVTSPAVLTRLALSFDAVVADLYWIRSIQYYGGRRLSTDAVKDYDLLYPLLDLTTSLDPDFSIAYRFGAFFLSERAPGGAGRPDLAIALLEKAMRRHPERWEYPHDVGFVYYRDGDYKEAAQWFTRASALPDAAEWLAPLAAVTLATGGDTRASRVLWTNILASDEEWLKDIAKQRLQQLDAIDTIAVLEERTAEYQRRMGKPPGSWEDMIRAGLIPGLPIDPAGHPYVLEPFTGSVTVRDDSPMWPLPTERPA